MYKKFTIEEVNELTNNGYEEEMAWLFAERLNDALDNEEHIVPCDLRNDLARVFASDRLRSLLISSIELAEMAEFKMDSYAEFSLVLDDLVELLEILEKK